MTTSRPARAQPELTFVWVDEKIKVPRESVQISTSVIGNNQRGVSLNGGAVKQRTDKFNELQEAKQCSSNVRRKLDVRPPQVVSAPLVSTKRKSRADPPPPSQAQTTAAYTVDTAVLLRRLQPVSQISL
jgi:hypothetical protein